MKRLFKPFTLTKSFISRKYSTKRIKKFTSFTIVFALCGGAFYLGVQYAKQPLQTHVPEKKEKIPFSDDPTKYENECKKFFFVN